MRGVSFRSGAVNLCRFSGCLRALLKIEADVLTAGYVGDAGVVGDGGMLSDW